MCIRDRDVAGDIVLDAAGEEVIFKDGSTNVGHVSMASDNLTIKSLVSDKDIVFQGNDGGSGITALTLDMSDAGTAIFNHDISLASDAAVLTFGANNEITLTHVHDVGITLTNTISDTDNRPIVLNLKSEEDAIVADDEIGRIDFTAGDSDGTDAGDNLIGEDETPGGESILLENAADTGDPSYLINEEYIVGDQSTDKVNQNELFEQLDDEILDFSESNPFGDAGEPS